MLPREAEGRIVDPNWAVLGMRATRSDSLILDECWLPESAAVLRSDDTRQFRHNYLNWFWGSYTPVYRGGAQTAFDELRRVVHTRPPEDYIQPVAYYSDVRRHIAEISADLEAARLITYRSAWLSDKQGPTAETTAALYRARYVVGEAVSRITRMALTLGGAHGSFKTSRLEQLFRDGALGLLHPPPSDFCLYNMGPLRVGHRSRRSAAIDEAGSGFDTHPALSRKGEGQGESRWRSKAAVFAARYAIQPKPTQRAQQFAIAGIAKNSPAALLPRSSE